MIGFCAAAGIWQLRYELWHGMSLSLEELNRMLYQRTLPPGLILVQPRTNTFVIAGDEDASRKALRYLRNSFSGPLWWPMT